MENYFNYFTEIEEHFLRRRAGGLLLSTLDWALIETWKESGVPLKAVLRGIDNAFDRYDQRPSKAQKVNSLAYCAQAVLAAAEDMKEAAVGANVTEDMRKSSSGEGLEPELVAAFLRRNADLLDSAKWPHGNAISMQTIAADVAKTLRNLADEKLSKPASRLEDLERRLTVLEEKLFAALLASMSDEDVVAVRAQADRDLAPYRRKLSAAQIDQLQKQYVHKALLDKYGVARFSLFYM